MRHHRMHAYSLSVCLTAAACAASSPRAPSAATPSARLTPMARYYDATQIHRSGATTAWDALRFLAPHQPFFDVGPLGSRRTPSTSGSGLTGMPAPRVLLDGFALSDLSLLRVIPASEVIDIQLLGSVDATMIFGAGYGGGVVVVRTVAGLRR